MAYFGFFADADLTQPLTQIEHIVNADTGGILETSFYFGSPNAGYKATPSGQATAIKVMAVDTDTSNPHTLGQGQNDSQVYFRLSPNGPWQFGEIEIGNQVLGGPPNAIRVYVKIVEPAGNVAVYTDFQITTNEYRVEAV